MTNGTQDSFQFPVPNRRRVEVNFHGGDITFYGGVLLLQIDRRLGLTESLAGVLDAPRRRASCEHDSLSLSRQRVYALALNVDRLLMPIILKLEHIGAVLAFGAGRVYPKDCTSIPAQTQGPKSTSWTVMLMVQVWIASIHGSLPYAADFR